MTGARFGAERSAKEVWLGKRLVGHAMSTRLPTTSGAWVTRWTFKANELAGEAYAFLANLHGYTWQDAGAVLVAVDDALAQECARRAALVIPAEALLAAAE